MRKIVVVVYGPPGSGKGTQANLLAAKLNLIHFDTGRFFESVVHDPSRQKDKIIRRERKLFDGGILMTPRFILREVSRATKAISRAGQGIIFSGSPRTMYEAKGLMPLLSKLYGKNHIHVFVLTVPEKTSILRNSRRIVCRVCRAPLLTAFYPSRNPKHCPVCGGPFYKRTLDSLGVIKVRLKEYLDRTEPVLRFLKRGGYRVYQIDGTAPPYRVFGRISRLLAQKKF